MQATHTAILHTWTVLIFWVISTPVDRPAQQFMRYCLIEMIFWAVRIIKINICVLFTSTIYNHIGDHSNTRHLFSFWHQIIPQEDIFIIYWFFYASNGFPPTERCLSCFLHERSWYYLERTGKCILYKCAIFSQLLQLKLQCTWGWPSLISKCSFSHAFMKLD